MPVHDWQYWDAYLAKGRSKNDRPVCNNTRIRRLSDGNIGLTLHGHTIAVYYPDGDVAISLCGWDTVTTKERLNRFTPARVGSNYERGDKRATCIHHSSDPVSPAKVQKCRKCKGTGREEYVRRWLASS